MTYHPLRIALRLTLFLWIVVGSLCESLLRIGRPSRPGAYRERADWLQRWSRRTLRSFQVQCHVVGQPPRSGLLLSNHLSYLDVVALAAQQPMVFVSKQEVRNWPLIGSCVRCAGTIFVNRERRADVKRVADQFAPVIDSQVVLALFPEGTSSDGSRLLPFHSSLLAPAENRGWAITPVWIAYRVEDGVVERDVAYWGDLLFATHFLRLVSRRRIHAFIAYGEPLPNGLDRKEMARAAQASVEALRARHLPRFELLALDSIARRGPGAE